MTLEGAIVDALKMNFNIGDYDDGNDQYDESERWVDEQRRFHVNQANGAVFIISTYNVFKHEQWILNFHSLIQGVLLMSLAFKIICLGAEDFIM